MKRYLLLLPLLFPVLSGYAQPTLTQANHGLAPGLTDNAQPVVCDNTGESGAGVRWDFGGLQATGARMFSTTTSNTSGKIVMNEAGETLFYFETTGTANLYSGFESADKVVFYNQPVAKLRFPFTFGDNFNEAYEAYSLYPLDSLSGTLAGTCHVTADAYGTIVLPDGRTIENVLRIKVVDTYSEKVCHTTEVATEKYLWYASENRFPVFAVSQIIYGFTDTAQRDTIRTACYALLDEPEATTESDHDQGKGNNAETETTTETEEPTIALYPNPASTFIEVYSSVELLQYQLRSMSGVIHKTGKVSSHEQPLHIQLPGLMPGWYTLNVETATGWLVRTFVIK